MELLASNSTFIDAPPTFVQKNSPAWGIKFILPVVIDYCFIVL